MTSQRDALLPRKQPALYYIRIQQRAEYNGLYGLNDRRSFRQYSAWPKTFPTRALAEEFMRQCFTFKGLKGRKLTASVERCRTSVDHMDVLRQSLKGH